MRALFRPFALHAAYTPIETIVFFCIIGTLAYFHILSAIKHSAFLDPNHSVYAAPTLRPAHVVWNLRMGEWVGVREGVWWSALKNKKERAEKEVVLEVQQVVFSLDGVAKSSENQPALSLATPPLSTSTLNLTNHLTVEFKTPSGQTYPVICHRPALVPVNHSDKTDASSGYGDCFTMQHTGLRTVAQTLAFKPGMRDEWVAALLGEDDAGHSHGSHGHGHSHANSHAAVFTDESGVRFEVDKTRLGAEAIPLAQMRNGKWMAYAARSLVVRFWDLAKKADSLDILLILAGYLLMHMTFYLLLTRSRSLGSSFFLPLAIMSSSILALIIALPIAMALKIPIDPVALTEALPFLVCTVGFDKPLRLARAVFMHPHLSVPPALVPGTTSDGSGYPVVSSTSTSISGPSGSLLAPPPTHSSSAAVSSQQLKPAPKIITESLSHVYAPIIRDYILEIAVLTVGAYSRVGGLKEVCALAALILAVDCLLLCTYLAAILGVMVEVRRIKTVRAMTRSRSNSLSSVASTSSSATTKMQYSAMAKPFIAPPPKTLRQRVKTILLGGEKGAGLPGYGEVYVRGRIRKVDGVNAGKKRSASKGKGGVKDVKENPVARLKLLLIASFLTLHILNFITPLTPSKHNHSSASALNNVRKVDITAPGMRAVLAALVDASSVELSSDLYEDENGEFQGKDMLVRVSPPVYVRVVLPPSMLGHSTASSKNNNHASKPFSSVLSHGISFIPASSSSSSPSSPSSRKSTSEHWDAFMDSWTRLVGDPVLSKWIVLLLTLSVVLNGYLLKSIAAGLVGNGTIGLGVGARMFGARGGVRFEGVGAEGEESEDDDTQVKIVEERKFAGVAAPEKPVIPSIIVKEKQKQSEVEPTSPTALAAPPAIGTFTLEDVDRKLKIASTIGKPTAKKLTVSAATAGKTFSGSTTRSASTTTLLGNPTPPLTSSEGSSSSSSDSAEMESPLVVESLRSLEECMDIFDNGPRPLSASLELLSDEEVILLAQNGKIAAYALEKVLGMNELERAVRIRRALISRASRTQSLESSDIPLTNYDYSRVLGACCENVVGYIPIPLGIAGPLNVDGTLYPIPMATAEGTLVASTSRGCKALNAGGGVTTVLIQDAMTRGPAIDFPSVVMAADAKAWIDSEDGYATIKEAFESTSRFARLKNLKTAMAGRTLFVRFATATGDAMGMNMISKGTEKGLEVMQKHYPEMIVLALSGNYCTDKKPAAINWIEGRGKSVVAEAVVPGKVVKTVLKTTVASLVNLNTKKNLVGSAMAGSIGGFNAHAANILTAMFLATGQDPAQNVESSMCMTLMEPINDGEDLLMTVSMPCIEVGTVGGGTVLSPQQGVLEMLGMKGAHPTHPGHNAQGLARLIAAAVMAGELSLLSALAAGHLIRAHMAHNRSQTNTPAPSVPPTPGLGGGVVLRAQLASVPAGSTAEGSNEGTEKAGLVVPAPGPLTPSSSTASLPPYSQ